jgi:hypothetical protein
MYFNAARFADANAFAVAALKAKLKQSTLLLTAR